jgi:hypothetical protein
MKYVKLTIVMVAVLALTVPAWAGFVPEFDAVGNDSRNPFAFNNAIQYGQVDAMDGGLNENSNFIGAQLGFFELGESFDTNAADLFADPCFGRFGVQSALTVSWNRSFYEWIIVLQLKPSSDINLNIYDCVKEFNSENDENPMVRWTRYAQTGRYQLPWNQIVFDDNMNPEVSVKAWPGDLAETGFNNSFTMDARTLPGLALVPMENQLYTSKALWSEGIVLARPETGVAGSDGQTQYTLKQGDLIQVRINTNQLPVDLYYGPDNVILKYIGFFGTYYYADR